MSDDLVHKRSVRLHGHLTSVSIEDAFWQALKDEADNQSRSINDLVAEIDEARTGGLSSAIRLFVLKLYQDRA